MKIVNGVYQNWAGTVRWAPANIRTPKSAEELATLLADAYQANYKVKVVGSGHSFSNILHASVGTTLISLENLDQISGVTRRADGEYFTTVGAGITLESLVEKLQNPISGDSFALKNLGSTAKQTIAGVICTNTHGSGQFEGGFANQVESLTLVDGSGIIHKNISRKNNKPLFLATVCGIGMTGVIVEATLRVIKLKNMEREKIKYNYSSIIDQSQLEEQLEKYAFWEAYWFPYIQKCLVYRRNYTDEPAKSAAIPNLKNWITGILANNLFKQLISLIKKASITCTKAYIKLIFHIQYLGGASKATVLPAPQALLQNYKRSTWKRLYDFEVFFPAKYAAQAIRKVDERLNEGYQNNLFLMEFPIHLRFQCADDPYLTHCPQREGIELYTAFSVPGVIENDIENLFFHISQAIEEVVENPDLITYHWGKNWPPFVTRKDIEKKYPGFKNWLEVRKQYDPGNIFQSRWSRSLFQLDI